VQMNKSMNMVQAHEELGGVGAHRRCKNQRKCLCKDACSKRAYNDTFDMFSIQGNSLDIYFGRPPNVKRRQNQFNN